ncbi:MAG: hypothetical protein JW703_05640 [Candidatus Diapherotrites archaeon]|nr:hypothetical protein [Candidatus Diapherotrites archaeon]
MNKNNEEYRATIEIKNETVLLKRSNSGNKFHANPKNQTTDFCYAGLITKKEKEELRKKTRKSNGYYTKRMKVRINPSEWGLKFHEFFTESKEEQDLVKELSKKFKIENITPNSKNARNYGNADLLLKHEQKRMPIEITICPPSYRKKEIKKGINAPHGPKWAKVTSRIVPLVLFSVENKSPSIIIIHKDWKKYGHTTNLQKSLAKVKCFLLYTNFQKKWENKITKKIEKILSDNNALPRN